MQCKHCGSDGLLDLPCSGFCSWYCCKWGGGECPENIEQLLEEESSVKKQENRAKKSFKNRDKWQKVIPLLEKEYVSSDGNEIYKTKISPYVDHCTCKGFKYKGSGECKHTRITWTLYNTFNT